MSYYSVNYEQDGIEIYFDNKPNEAVRARLKEKHWRWSGYKKCWYNFYTSENLQFAKNACGEMSSKVKGNIPLSQGKPKLSSDGTFCELKKELIETEHTIEGVKTCILDLYAHNETQFKKIKKEGVVSDKALEFLDMCGLQIENDYSDGAAFFRINRYEETLHHYCNNLIGQTNKPENKQLKKNKEKKTSNSETSQTYNKRIKRGITLLNESLNGKWKLAKRYGGMLCYVDEKKTIGYIVEGDGRYKKFWLQFKGERPFKVQYGEVKGYEKKILSRVEKEEHKIEEKEKTKIDKTEAQAIQKSDKIEKVVMRVEGIQSTKQESEKKFWEQNDEEEIIEDEVKAPQIPRKKQMDTVKKCRPVKKQERYISPTDFIVRKSDFKCVHNEHAVEDVIAVAKVISPKGEKINMKVSAGHCKTCDVYYIMNSYFDVLRRAGIPICRVSDEKTYKKNLECGEMGLAAESKLMQYGYNVNKDEDLSDLTRQNILASLIDNKIMRRTEIISYLDFFIEQRKGRSHYEIAISKWEKDREFVTHYNQSQSQEVRIRRILK